jgi:GNAT superfamily N-acetyltransferase
MPFKILTYLPPLFSIRKEVGTLLNIALLPEERGKGYGRIIHSRGLMILKEMGLKTYIGSTETNNYAMLKVFKLNKCRKSMIQHFYCTKK